MTTHKSYSCNLCGAHHMTEGAGVYFGAMHDIKLTALRDAENHLCDKCLLALDTALLDRARKEREQAESATYCPAVDA